MGDMPNISDGEIKKLYQQAIDQISLDDLEKTQKSNVKAAEEIREAMLEISIRVAKKHGLSPVDFGKLVALNGLSILAVGIYRSQLNAWEQN